MQRTVRDIRRRVGDVARQHALRNQGAQATAVRICWYPDPNSVTQGELTCGLSCEMAREGPGDEMGIRSHVDGLAHLLAKNGIPATVFDVPLGRSADDILPRKMEDIPTEE